MPAPVPPSDLDELGAMLRARRKELKLSQDALARRLGIVQSHLSGIELGSVADLGSSLVVRLAEVLDLDPGDIVRAAGARAHSVPPAA
jgi:transcriptional regulator with XRE-family HTH domain